jgi:tetratricopeptide (TPR) repeat protein
VEKRAFAMAAVAAAPESEFAKEWSPATDESTDFVSLAEKIVRVDAENQAPEWSFPHVVVKSPLGERVFIGPTRYPDLTDEERSKYQKEVQKLRWAIRLQPRFTALQTKLAKLLVRLGRHEEGLEVFEATTQLRGKLDPTETIVEELYGMGQVEKAKALLKAYIQQGHSRWLNEFHLLLGVIYTEQGQDGEAFACFRDGYKRIWPGENGGLNVTTVGGDWRNVMQASGTIEQVVATYQNWIALGNRYSLLDPIELSRELGTYLVQQGKPEEAITVYGEALTRKHGEGVLYDFSRLLVELNRPEEAINLYKEAIGRRPENIGLRDSLARLYGRIGKPAERLAILRELVPLYQKRIEGGNYSRQSLAWLYRKLGQIEDARAIEREMLKEARAGGLWVNSDAMLYATSDDPNFHDPDMAIEYAKRACELTQYSQSMILDTLATAYAAKGDFDSAVAWQLKAIELCDDGAMDLYQQNLKLFREKKAVPLEKWNWTE